MNKVSKFLSLTTIVLAMATGCSDPIFIDSGTEDSGDSGVAADSVTPPADAQPDAPTVTDTSDSGTVDEDAAVPTDAQPDVVVADDGTTDAGTDTTTDSGMPTDTFMCPTGETLCGTRCVNLQNDPLNCGSCGNDITACGVGCAQHVCVGGTIALCNRYRCPGSDACANPFPAPGSGACDPSVYSCDGNACGGTMICPDLPPTERVNLHCDPGGWCWCS